MTLEAFLNDIFAEDDNDSIEKFERFVESGKLDTLYKSIAEMSTALKTFPMREALSDPGAVESVCTEQYKEIFRLKDMLEENNIPFEFNFMVDIMGYQIAYPENGLNRICSVIETSSSYGHENDLLEIMGLLTDEENKYDDVAGNLTAEDVFERIKNDYMNKKEAE